ncbi:MAG: hypothetical protein M3Y08_13950 [Fibrobacterota bacterium]|nr:hypothetical protein [Fibrobacterota bacterium]
MFRSCLLFVFALFTLLATTAYSQTNSEKSSQVPATTPILPRNTQDSVAADSAKAANKAVRDAKAAAKKDAKARKQAAADSAKAAKETVSDTAKASVPSAVPDTAKAAAPEPQVPAAPAPGAVAPADTVHSPAALDPSAQGPTAPTLEAPKVEEAVRQPQDIRLFNDPTLIAKEYGFGVAGSLVAGALGFYIGSGIETAIEGESNASKGTLSFTGIRYDNYKGAFWGGATGMVIGSALTTYFIGQTDEEDGGFMMTILGTAAAAGGTLYVAHLMGVNDDIDWKPFIPLLAIPSIGGTLGFNVSRWFHDRKREEVVGKQSSIWLHPPTLAWGRDARGDRMEIKALHLTF